ncbi:MAG: SPFH domain-containing protein [Armatimonadota bacterium]
MSDFLGAGPRVYAMPTGQHVSLGASLRFILWFIPTLIVGFTFLGLYGPTNTTVVLTIIAAILIRVIVGGVRVAAQWERGVILRLGKFLQLRGPGTIYVVPFVDFVRFVDTRTLVLNIPRQKVITRDNVPAEIDGALFYLITDAEKAVLRIQDYQYAIAQYAQAALRDVVGRLSLDELLSERERIQEDIRESVEEHVTGWGMHVDSIRLLDIELPEDLMRMMSRQASAEREKRATITKAEGDKLAAFNLSDAASTMQKSPGAMQLRTLQTIDGLGPSSSNTVVLFPVEWTDMVRMLQAKPPPPPNKSEQ